MKEPDPDYWEIVPGWVVIEELGFGSITTIESTEVEPIGFASFKEQVLEEVCPLLKISFLQGFDQEDSRFDLNVSCIRNALPS